MLNFCAFFLVSAQSSELYRKIDVISALNILRRTNSDIVLEDSAFLFLLKAAQANSFLLLTSFDVSNKLSRYL